jgi:hypothetical protein
MEIVTPNGHGLGYMKRTGRPALPGFVPVAVPGAAQPAVVDMRNQFLPAFDQGQYGTCTCNTIAAQVEHALLRQHVTVPYHRSRLYPYYYSGVIEGNTGDVGRDPRDVLTAVEQHGIPPEKDWPYNPAELLGTEPSAAAQHAADRRHIVKAYEVPIALTAVLTALANGYSVGIAFPVYDSFESVGAQTTGVVPIPQAGEQLLGYHETTIGGYTKTALPDVPANYLLVLNSWGTGWGKDGWIFLPFAWIGGTAPDGQALTQELIAVELVTP